MGTGLIYAFIVLAWAAVLIPMWLRRHDDAAETRQVEGFSRAMRVLARRNPTSAPARRYVVMPPRNSVAEVHVSGPAIRRRSRRPSVAAGLTSRGAVHPALADLPAQVHPPRRRPTPVVKRTRSLAARRRRMLLGLALLTGIVAVAVLLHLVPTYVLIPVGLLLLAFVVHLRGQARASREATRRRRTGAQRTARRARRLDSSERIAAARLAGRLTPDVVAGIDEADQDLDGWEPRPVTLPTYVGKGKAPSYLRESTWASFVNDQGIGTPAPTPAVFDQVAERADDPVATPEDDEAAVALDQEFDTIFERRRAVGD